MKRRELIFALGGQAGLLALGSAASGCAPAPLPHGLRAGEGGRVSLVHDGDALSLDTGLSVRLAEIEAPAGARKDRPGEMFATEAEAHLAGLVAGEHIELAYGGLSRDKYERAIAHVFMRSRSGKRAWLNLELVAAGMARVHSYPDNCRCLASLLKAERQARTEGLGLWALPEYRVLAATEADAGRSRFNLIEGEAEGVMSVETTAEPERDPRLRIRGCPLDIRLQGPEVLSAAVNWRGPIRIRGWISKSLGLRIDHPGQVEMLSA